MTIDKIAVVKDALEIAKTALELSRHNALRGQEDRTFCADCGEFAPHRNGVVDPSAIKHRVDCAMSMQWKAFEKVDAALAALGVL